MYVPEKTKESPIQMNIILTNETPIYESPRRLPHIHKIEVENQVMEWLEQGIIEESNSEFASPVDKKDGTKRLCIDYRRINEMIIKDRFPLPSIEDQLNALQQGKYFSVLDIKTAFFHVSIVKNARFKYTSFVVENGQYQFKYCPFGLCTSPAVFSRFIYTIFKPLIKQRIVLLYMATL